MIVCGLHQTASLDQSYLPTTRHRGIELSQIRSEMIFNEANTHVTGVDLRLQFLTCLITACGGVCGKLFVQQPDFNGTASVISTLGKKFPGGLVVTVLARSKETLKE